MKIKLIKNGKKKIFKTKMMNVLDYQMENRLLKPAGKENDNKVIGTGDCMLLPKKGETPEKLKKYRKSNLLQIGKTTLNFGNFDYVQNYDENHQHGIKTQKLENVSNLMKNENNFGFKKFENNLKEQIYDSNKTKPLGKGLTRNYIYPESIDSPDFLFGKKTFHDEKIKNLQETKEEIQRAEELYKKSHNSFKTGEQKNRNYNWGIDIDKHVFGNKNEKSENILDCLKDKEQNQTLLINKNVLDFRNLTKAKIGTSLTNKINPIFEFHSKDEKTEVGVKDCLNFQDSDDFDTNFTNLGKSKNQELNDFAFNTQQVFGLSTHAISTKNNQISKHKHSEENEKGISFFERLNYNYEDKKIDPNYLYIKRNKREIEDIIKSTHYSNIDVERVLGSFLDDQISLKQFIDRSKSFRLIK